MIRFNAMNDSETFSIKLFCSDQFSPPTLPQFGIGEIIKTRLSGLTPEAEDICLIIGVAYNYQFHAWLYELKVIGSLSSYLQDRAVFSVGSWVRRDEASLEPLTTLDRKRYQKTTEKHLKLINGGKR